MKKLNICKTNEVKIKIKSKNKDKGFKSEMCSRSFCSMTLETLEGFTGCSLRKVPFG